MKEVIVVIVRAEVVGDVHNGGNGVTAENVDGSLSKVDDMKDPTVVVMWQDDRSMSPHLHAR